VDIDFERHERIGAPIERVWEEVGSLDEILAKSPHVSAHHMLPDGHAAELQVQLKWGPVKRTIKPVAKLVDVRPCEGLLLVIDAPTMDLHFKGTMSLDPGGEAETVLTYCTHLESAHGLSERMRPALSEMLESHVHDLVDGVKARAERHHQAAEQLLD
jgi:carbon monoxide dehydrogenase subunit G